MMYGIWNRREGSQKQVLRYFNSYDEAEQHAASYLNNGLNDPYRSEYWGEPDEYDIIEFQDAYPLTYIVSMPSCYALVDLISIKELLEKKKNDLSEIKPDEWPFLSDICCCFKSDEDAFEEMDFDQAMIEFRDGDAMRITTHEGPIISKL